MTCFNIRNDVGDTFESLVKKKPNPQFKTR
jgi:hypothetical protein